MMIHYVYKIINLKNGLYYVGSRSCPDPKNDSYMSSSKVMKNLYKLEGIKNFKKEIIGTFDTRKEANEFEDLLITKVLKEAPGAVYNLRRSGCKDNNLNIFNKRNDIWGDFYKEIRNKYLEGSKPNELANFYNCDRGTIDNVIKDLVINNTWSKAWNFEKDIIFDYNKGHSRKFLSKKYNCDIGTIRTILIKNNIVIRSIKDQFFINKQKGISQGKKREVDLVIFNKLYIIDNLTLRETAKKLGIHESTLKRIAIKNNIPIKDRGYYCKNRIQRHPSWKKIKEIKEDLKLLNKKEILLKYNIKDYSTLNKMIK